LMMPVSVLERLFTALFAAGVLTAFPDDRGVFELGLVGVAPLVFLDEPRLRALDVFGPVEPPVPLTVLPPEREPPAPAPVEDPLDIWAKVGDVMSAKQQTTAIAENFMLVSQVCAEIIRAGLLSSSPFSARQPPSRSQEILHRTNGPLATGSNATRNMPARAGPAARPTLMW
jgi:hypothetical protein